MSQRDRNRIADRDHVRRLTEAQKREHIVFGAAPEIISRNDGGWMFVRGPIREITIERTLFGRRKGAEVTIEDPIKGLVTLKATQVRWRGVESYKATPVVFAEIAMCVAEEIRAEYERLRKQWNGELRRPYDFNVRDCSNRMEEIKADLEIISELADVDMPQMAEAIEQNFDYPQTHRDVAGSRTLWSTLHRKAAGRLPFYEQMALTVFYRLASGWGSRPSSYYRDWQHDDDCYFIAPNLVEIAMECVMGPEVKHTPLFSELKVS